MNEEKYKSILEQEIEEAIALPFLSYTDIGIFEKEMNQVFFNDWVFVCHEKQIEEEGDYYNFKIGAESLSIIRTKNNEVKVLSNHCRHRGAKILNEGFGNTKTLVCPYHSWAYSLDGDLKGVAFSGNIQPEKAKHCLNKFRVENWMGFLFVNLSGDASPLRGRYKDIEKYLDLFDISKMKYANKSEAENWNCNWKLAMENAMESYHLFSVHKNTLEKTTPTKKAYYIEGEPNWSLTGGEMVDINESLLSKLLLGETKEYQKHYVLISLPPNFVAIVTYESISWIQILPHSTSKVSVCSGSISPYKGEDSKKNQAFVKQFFEEDRIICEEMQRSMQSQFSEGGKLVEMEMILTDFRQYIANKLFSSKVGKRKMNDAIEHFPF